MVHWTAKTTTAPSLVTVSDPYAAPVERLYRPSVVGVQDPLAQAILAATPAQPMAGC